MVDRPAAAIRVLRSEGLEGVSALPGAERPWQTGLASGDLHPVPPKWDAPSAVHRLDRSLGGLTAHPAHPPAAQNISANRCPKPAAPCRGATQGDVAGAGPVPPNSARFRTGCLLGLPVTQGAAPGAGEFAPRGGAPSMRGRRHTVPTLEGMGWSEFPSGWFGGGTVVVQVQARPAGIVDSASEPCFGDPQGRRRNFGPPRCGESRGEPTSPWEC